MYEEIVAQVRRTSEAAVRESQERVDLAASRSEAADKKAAEASKAAGERWTNRINAMRRRSADRDNAKNSSEMRFGHEDGPHPNDSGDGDELISLTTAPAAAPGSGAPPFGAPEELVQQQEPAPETVSRPNPEANRFMSNIGSDYEDERPPSAAPTFSPPTRRSPPPRRHARDDDDDDYSGQSWLEGR